MEKDRRIFIEATSVADEGAIIGDGAQIGHFCRVEAGARIGRNCVIKHGVFIGGQAAVGESSIIENNVSIYDEVTVEEEVFVGPSAVFTNAALARADFYRKSDTIRTLVKRGASVGANATIIAGVTVGRYAFVGSGSVVTKDVPDFSIAFGNPARLRGFVCACGQKMRAEEREWECQFCGRRFKKVSDEKIEEV